MASTNHDSSKMFQLQSEGASGTVLEDCCRTAASIIASKRLVIDLKDVDLIGPGSRPNMVLRRAATIFLFASAFLLNGMLLPAQEPQAPPSVIRLTLREAVELALKQNPQVQLANLNVAETQQDQALTRSALFPQVNGTLGGTVRKINTAANIGIRTPFIPQVVGPFSFVQGGAQGSAPIFDLTLWKRLRLSKQNVETSRFQERLVREQYTLLSISQYLGSMRDEATLHAATSRVDLAQAIFDQAGDLQKAGVGTGIDTLRANVELQNEKQRLIVAETELNTSLLGLARLLNLPSDKTIELTDHLQAGLEQPGKGSAPEGMTLKEAYDSRPEMQVALSRAKAAELQQQVARAEYLPKLSLQGGYIPVGLHFSDMTSSYDYEAALTIPLYTGGRIRADVKRAGLERKRAEQNTIDARNQITQEVKTAQAQLNAASREVEVATLGVKLAQEEVSQARDRFQAGVANNIEVVTAQDRLARANDDEIAALYRLNQARADLAHSYGAIEKFYTH